MIYCILYCFFLPYTNSELCVAMLGGVSRFATVGNILIQKPGYSEVTTGLQKFTCHMTSNRPAYMLCINFLRPCAFSYY